MTPANAACVSDLTLSRLQAALASLKDDDRSLWTIHHHVRLVENFSRRCWRDGRTPDDRLAHSKPPDNPESDRRRKRRAFTVAKLERLTIAAEHGPIRGQLSGVDRAML